MNAKHLILTLSLTLAAGAAAALSRSAGDLRNMTSAVECGDQASEGAIPRVVVTARRDQVDAAAVQIPRVVITGHRAGATLAAVRS